MQYDDLKLSPKLKRLVTIIVERTAHEQAQNTALLMDWANDDSDLTNIDIDAHRHLFGFDYASIIQEAEEEIRRTNPARYPYEHYPLYDIAVSRRHFTRKPREILRGSLQPVFVAVHLEKMSDYLIKFIKSSEGDEFDRDNHNFGWHYHYLTAKGDRTDIMMCWDNRALRKGQEHPFFYQKHGPYQATAKIALWGDEKRKSAHDACFKDLSNWPMSTFLCASAKSLPLWPKTSVLTPPDPPSTNTKAKKKRR